MEKQLIVKRINDYFLVEKKFFEEYMRKLGLCTTYIYLTLCYYAEKKSIPDVRDLSFLLAIDKTLIIDSLKALEEANIIKIQRKENEMGSWDNCLFILNDLGDWKDLE